MPLKRTWTDDKGKKRTQTFENKVEANRSFAFAIANKRLKNGSSGTHWLDEAFGTTTSPGSWSKGNVPENSEAIAKLRRLLLMLAGDAQFFLEIVDPNKPDPK
jgi:hypothetical protein